MNEIVDEWMSEWMNEGGLAELRMPYVLKWQEKIPSQVNRRDLFLFVVNAKWEFGLIPISALEAV